MGAQMKEEDLHQFRVWMDYLTDLLRECVDKSSWDLYYNHGYPFDAWFIAKTSDEDVLEAICEDFRV